MTPSRLPTTIVTFCGALLIGSALTHAAAPAADDASDSAYSGGWSNGSNGGAGFSPWALTHGSNSGFFVGDSSLNASGSSGNINTTGAKSWGEFANTNDVAAAVRPFTLGGSNGSASLDIGQQFIMKLDTGFVQNGGTVGFGLLDSTGLARLEFFFVGGQTKYTVSDSGTQTTAHGFTGDGLTATFTLTTPDTYSLKLDFNTGTPTTENFTGTLRGTAGAGIDRVRIFNANAGAGSSANAYANSMQIVPEPSALMLAGLASMGMLALRRQR